MAWSQCNTLVREAIYIFPRTCPAPDRKRIIFLGHVQRPDIVTRSDKNTCFLASHIYSLLISAAPYPIWLCIPGRTPPCCHSYHFSQQPIRGVPVEPWLNESRRSRLNPANSGFHLAFICEDHWLTTTSIQLLIPSETLLVRELPAFISKADVEEEPSEVIRMAEYQKPVFQM